MPESPDTPVHIDLQKDRGLRVRWGDGVESYYPIGLLRRLSPSADMRELRRAMETNPLTVLPDAPAGGGIEATDAELVGNYAIRITFSDGHSSGIFTWEYLRQIDPAQGGGEKAPGDDGPAHDDPLGLGGRR